jgi:hypothetical protein
MDRERRSFLRAAESGPDIACPHPRRSGRETGPFATDLPQASDRARTRAPLPLPMRCNRLGAGLASSPIRQSGLSKPTGARRRQAGLRRQVPASAVPSESRAFGDTESRRDAWNVASAVVSPDLLERERIGPSGSSRARKLRGESVVSMPAPCAISPGTRPCARCEAPRAGPSACARVRSCGTERRTGRAPSPCRCGKRSRSRARTRSSRAPHAGRP